ncbi:hypothetical protein GCM10010172_53910 [Paractinoplanes ferrugineus]|uniref:Uncharacterized protein n=1 Tax=Paractinoplanes ferrugineus TaxID=113564 RepID=A0A919M9R1_9ACTN|nr:hypothetical protein Afe05nite_36310 [Actinoplanes ferrugineus]
MLLGLLALGVGHSLLVEIRRQAHRQVRRWARTDTINAVLLGCWAELALIMSILEAGQPTPVRIVNAALAAAYGGSCVYFVHERRRIIRALPRVPRPAPPAEPETESEIISVRGAA